MLKTVVQKPDQFTYGKQLHLETLSTFAESASFGLLEMYEKSPIMETRLRAGQKLINLMIRLADKLNQLAKREPSAAIYFAIQLPAWPALIYANKKHSSEMWKFVTDKLKLGAAWNRRLTGRLGKSVEWRVAERLVDRICKYRAGGFSGDIVSKAKSLKPFTKDTRPEWWKVAELIMEEFYGSEFWAHQRFKHWLGRKHSEKDGNKSVRASYSLKKPGPLARDLKKAIKKNFFQLTPKAVFVGSKPS